MNTPTRDDIDELWAYEAEKRVQEVESGEVELLDGEQVFSELWNRYIKLHPEAQQHNKQQ